MKQLLTAVGLSQLLLLACNHARNATASTAGEVTQSPGDASTAEPVGQRQPVTPPAASSSTASPVAEKGEVLQTFDQDPTSAAPLGFAFGRTGSGAVGKWIVRADSGAPSGANVLAQVDTDSTDYRFPIAVLSNPVLRDVRVSVRCKSVSGSVDHACGLVARYRDENNYFVTRANALEDNVRLYKVVRGERRQIAGWNGKVSSEVWHVLAFELKGDHLKVNGAVQHRKVSHEQAIRARICKHHRTSQKWCAGSTCRTRNCRTELCTLPSLQRQVWRSRGVPSNPIRGGESTVSWAGGKPNRRAVGQCSTPMPRLHEGGTVVIGDAP